MPIALGDHEECQSGHPGVVGRCMPLLKQIRIVFRELLDGLRGQECLPLLLMLQDSPLIDDAVPKTLQLLRCWALWPHQERAATSSEKGVRHELLIRKLGMHEINELAACLGFDALIN